MPGLLALIGSGEVAAGMIRLHRRLLSRLEAPPRAAFLDTPAGFELGVEAIEARFRDYAERRLGIPLSLASFRSASATPESVASALRALADANYILAGPGSPSYAASQWKGSAVFDAVMSRWKAGAQIVWASSAAIALSRHVLPVYEIYKVGAPLHWLAGLDLLGEYGFDLAIVTHWDNAEGGTHDTRACFMGMERFERLRAMLPRETAVLGIDEHTVCTLDLDAGMAEVGGRGGVVILTGNEHLRHEHGSTFALDELRAHTGNVLPLPGAAQAPSAPSPRDELLRASDLLARGELAPGLEILVQSAPAELAPLLVLAAQSARGMARPGIPPEPLIQLLIDVREALRAARQWQLSDQVRDGLAALGIALQDTSSGTTWSRSS